MLTKAALSSWLVENGGYAGGVQFRTGAGANSGTTVGNAFGTLDGGRCDNIRYDSLTGSGVAVGWAITSFSVAATLSTKFSGASVKAKSVEDNENDGNYEQWGLLASLAGHQHHCRLR